MNPFVRKARLQESLADEVRCLTCERRCVIAPGHRGVCKTRQNIDGKLCTLIYGMVSSLSANPIEKKPFFHFYPGTLALTAGSFGCNFTCPWCQNWEISKAAPVRSWRFYLGPEEFVEKAAGGGCRGTSISFNEPTLSLEWATDVFPLARRRGLYNTFVTNGYMTLQALDLLIDAGLDAINVDIKGSAKAVKRYCGVDVEVVWRNARYAKARGLHLEVTTLIIPAVNDDEKTLRDIARRIHREISPETPWHVTGYYPAYRFTTLATPVETLESAHGIGKSEGLRYVYVGNVPGHTLENTYCPRCGTLLIRRHGFVVTQVNLVGKACPQCGESIPIIDAKAPDES